MAQIFSIQGKIALLEQKFSSLSTLDARYQLLMDMGRALPPYPPEWKTDKNLVRGCQSILYLHAELRENKIFYSVYSDALISAGLAALLLSVYSGETPKTIVTTPPAFLQKLFPHATLSPMRSNGLAHLHRQMVQEALALFKKLG